MHIKEVTNEAKYVEWLNESTLAVWKGGHTINYYSYDEFIQNPHDRLQPMTCSNVGSFEQDSASLEEVKESISNFNLYE